MTDTLGNAVRLTNGLSARSPSWSPDGSRIAFSGGGGLPSLYVINRDGSGLTELLAGASSPDTIRGGIAWSPDGETIAFERGWSYSSQGPEAGTVPLRLYLFDIATSVVTTLTDSFAVQLAWSPDGSQVVFSYLAFGPLYRMEIDGSGVVELAKRTSRLLSARDPAWSPCTEIAFSGTVPSGDPNSPFAGAIYVMDSDGSNIRELTSGTKPSWSPDCSKIVFGPEALKLWIINADGSERRQLTRR